MAACFQWQAAVVHPRLASLSSCSPTRPSSTRMDRPTYGGAMGHLEESRVVVADDLNALAIL